MNPLSSAAVVEVFKPDESIASFLESPDDFRKSSYSVGHT